MGDMPPMVPPPGSGKPKPEIKPPKQKPKNIEPKPKSLTDDVSLEYMGFTFSSEKDLQTFRSKCLANMANLMITQMKRDNDRMIKALKKMRENP